MLGYNGLRICSKGAALGRRYVERFDRTEDFPLLRSRTTRRRRFLRPASFAGLSFLLERRDGSGKYLSQAFESRSRKI
jgi:hypothetical protein